MSKRVNQLSIFLENKTGRLHEMTQILADADVSIETINLVEAGDFGILRMIVADSSATKSLLESKGISVKITPVIVVEILDKVGCFNRVVSLLDGIDIQYTYTVNSHDIGAFIIKVADADIEQAIMLLEDDGVVVKDAV
jgi:hypothetical protein